MRIVHRLYTVTNKQTNTKQPNHQKKVHQYRNKTNTQTHLQMPEYALYMRVYAHMGIHIYLYVYMHMCSNIYTYPYICRFEKSTRMDSQFAKAASSIRLQTFAGREKVQLRNLGTFA